MTIEVTRDVLIAVADFVDAHRQEINRDNLPKRDAFAACRIGLCHKTDHHDTKARTFIGKTSAETNEVRAQEKAKADAIRAETEIAWGYVENALNRLQHAEAALREMADGLL